MKKHQLLAVAAAGFAAGAVNGLFGGGGGMVLIPLLSLAAKGTDKALFSSSVAIILPLCLVSLAASAGPIPWREALPWLPGSAIGGYLAAKWGEKIPVLWLHRGLGILIVYGGVRYLC